MAPRRLFYPYVIWEFVHTMTIIGDKSRTVLYFTLDGDEQEL